MTFHSFAKCNVRRLGTCLTNFLFMRELRNGFLKRRSGALAKCVQTMDEVIQ